MPLFAQHQYLVAQITTLAIIILSTPTTFIAWY